MGWWFWLNTAPVPVPKASVSRMKGLEKSRKANTSAWVTDSFNIKKASAAVWSQLKLSCFKTFVKGEAMETYLLMDLL